MKQLNWIFALLLAGTTSWLGADCSSCNEGCTGKGINLCCEDVSFSAYADVLYWKACKSDVDYTSNSTKHFLNPGHDVGYRLGATMHCDCKDIGVRYTSYEAKEHIVDGSNRAYELDMDVVDVEFGYRLSLDSVDATLRPFLGAKLAWIDELKNTSGDNDTIDMSGYGLYLGAEFIWPFYEAHYCDTCVPISLVARTSWCILDADFQVIEPGDDDWDKHCLFVGVYEGFLGVEFSICLCDCFDIDIMLGYEVQLWHGMRRFTDDDEIGNLGLNGLTVRFGSTF